MSTNTKKAKSAGYRPGSNYDQLFQVGASKLHTKEELIKAGSKATGKAQRLVTFDLAVLMSPGHPSNKGRSEAKPQHPAEGEKFRLVLIGAPKTVKPVIVKKAVAPVATPVATAPATPVQPVPVSATATSVPEQAVESATESK